uniref:LAGLIDADG endonuclease n=1 Tax=Ophiognomonia clavigignenti-juglandacearum TaxID=218668 RepID=A0A2C9DSC2_9PEZI|nr:LAGLIDADG endonuclease [Ophiognomonia clavigignenti-juglandacearum]
MASIKASINTGLSASRPPGIERSHPWGDSLKEAFPTTKLIDPSSLPISHPYPPRGIRGVDGLIDVKQGKSLNPYWVVGFTEAEGCFFVIVQQDKVKGLHQIKIGYQVSQHIRDLSLIKSLKDFFGCGRTEPCGKAAISLRVSKFMHLSEVIVPFFENYPLLGSKLQDFRDWKGITKLIASKAHLTPEGLNEIKRVKSGMNSLREFPEKDIGRKIKNKT